MSSWHSRSINAASAALMLLSLGLLYSCGPARLDPREDLLRSLRGEDLQGFYFVHKVTDGEEIATLTNSAVRDVINVNEDDTGGVLRYTRVRDKAANTVRTTKTEIVRKGTSLSLQVTDIGNNEVVSTHTFPTPVTRHADGIDSLQDCLREFDCINRGPLQCEANRTCKDQFAAIECCLSDGQCFSVHLIIRPTTPRCQLVEVIPEFEGLVLKK